MLALYALIVFISRPGRLSGIDSTNAIVAWIAVGGLILALMLVHVLIGKQLLRLAKGANVKHPL